MKRIAFLINSLYSAGGTERMTTLLANYLADKERMHVSIVSIHDGGESFFELSPSVSVYYVNRAKHTNIYTGYIRNLCRIRKIARQIRPHCWIDVCTAMSLMSIPALCGLGIRVISWEHFNANVDWNPITSRLSRGLAARFAYKIVALTHEDQAIFQQRFKARNVVCIPNPITISAETCSPLIEKNVLAIGRFTEQKGFDMLLDAWSLTKCKDNGWTLNIVGEGELENVLKQQSVLLGLHSVRFIKPTKDVVPYYKEASIYVMSSRFEGLPLVLIEALSMGLPIISFNCQTGPKDVVENGETGILVPSGDVEKLALALDALSDSPEQRRRFQVNALRKSEDFKMPRIANLWKEIIE